MILNPFTIAATLLGVAIGMLVGWLLRGARPTPPLPPAQSPRIEWKIGPVTHK